MALARPQLSSLNWGGFSRVNRKGTLVYREPFRQKEMRIERKLWSSRFANVGRMRRSFFFFREESHASPTTSYFSPSLPNNIVNPLTSHYLSINQIHNTGIQK